MDKAGFVKMVNTGWRMRMFLLRYLPGAWFMGISVRSFTGEKAVVQLPYSWRSQNPFRSIYFAAQCAAGEYSTGLLAMHAMQTEKPVSMLVAKVEAQFYKKASQTVYFTCNDGPLVQLAVLETIATGEPVVLRMKSTGATEDGTVVSEVWLDWSFKRR